MIQAKFDSRIKRAERTKHRQLRIFLPGQAVYYWRLKCKQKGAATGYKVGGFHGPARVLATETEKDEATGEMRSKGSVWIVAGGRLLVCSPEQLRPASAREEATMDLQQLPELPWTMLGAEKSMMQGQYMDIRGEKPTSEEFEDAESVQRVPESKTTWGNGMDVSSISEERSLPRKRVTKDWGKKKG